MFKSMFCSSFLLAQFVMCASVYSQETDVVDPNEDFRLEFPGGTVAEYVDMLQAKPFYDSDRNENVMLNLVVLPSATHVRLPKIKLETNAGGAVSLLDGYQTESVRLVVEYDPSGNMERIRAEYKEPFGVIVVNCRQLLEGNPDVNNLIEAIEFGLDMQGDKVEIKLHEKTGLLFAKGTSSATRLVEQTISELAEAEGINVSQARFIESIQQTSGEKESQKQR